MQVWRAGEGLKRSRSLAWRGCFTIKRVFLLRVVATCFKGKEYQERGCWSLSVSVQYYRLPLSSVQVKGKEISLCQSMTWIERFCIFQKFLKRFSKFGELLKNSLTKHKVENCHLIQENSKFSLDFWKGMWRRMNSIVRNTKDVACELLKTKKKSLVKCFKSLKDNENEISFFSLNLEVPFSILSKTLIIHFNFLQDVSVNYNILSKISQVSSWFPKISHQEL